MSRYLLSKLLFSVCLYLLVFSGCTQEDQNPLGTESTAKLAGKIAQSESGAVIYLEQGRIVDSAAIASEDGYFVFDDLQPGTYKLRIEAPGYDNFSVFIKVEPGNSYEFGTVALADISADNSDTIPSVYDYKPLNGSEVIYLPPDKYNEGSSRLSVSVSFDRPMNRLSVEEAITIEPPVQGGYYVWSQNMTKYNYAQPVQATQWESAEDLITVDNRDIRKSSFLDVTLGNFGSSYAPPSAVISSYSVAKSFTYYFPKSGCFTDTTYKITIATTAVDTAGTPLDTALEFYFKTVQSSISYDGVQMNPPNGDDWVDLLALQGISLTFPHRMDEASTEANIGITPAQSLVFLWQDFNKLNIYTGGILIPDTTYVVTIGAQAEDVEGTALGQDNVLSFKTRPIRVQQSIPAKGQMGVDRSTDIILSFNTYMDQTSFQGLLHVVSADGDTVAGVTGYDHSCRGYTYSSCTPRYYLDRIWFNPSQNLNSNKLYTIYLKAGVKDLNGYGIKYDYDIQFLTMP